MQQKTHRTENGKPPRNILSLSTKNGNSVKWKKVETFSQPNLENGIPFYREGTVGVVEADRTVGQLGTDE